MTEPRNGIRNREAPISEADFKGLLKILETVDYGSVTLIIQSGKVVQVEKNEKMRLK